MALITAQEFLDLKEKIQAEFAERTCTAHGVDLAQYTSEEYNFTTAPKEGGRIMTEQGEKTINLLLKANVTLDSTKDPGNNVTISSSDIVPEVSQGKKITTNGKDLITFINNLTTIREAGANTSITGCSGLCAGLCYGACFSSNTGKCSSCRGGCKGCAGCDSGCDGCRSGCGGGCFTEGSCGKGCGDGCSKCSSACSSGCRGCDGDCDGSTGRCSTCSGNCSEGCEDGCGDTCKDTCKTNTNIQQIL